MSNRVKCERCGTTNTKQAWDHASRVMQFQSTHTSTESFCPSCRNFIQKLHVIAAS